MDETVDPEISGQRGVPEVPDATMPGSLLERLEDAAEVLPEGAEVPEGYWQIDLPLEALVATAADLEPWQLGTILDRGVEFWNAFRARVEGPITLGRTVFADRDLSGIDLHGVDLTGASFIRCNMGGGDLSGALLREATFEGGGFNSVSFGGALLEEARFVGDIYIVRCDLSEATLDGADLSGARVYGSNLSGARMPRANLRGSEFHQDNLDGVDLTGADLSGAHVSKSSLRGTTLGGADLSRANLSQSDLSGADLTDANLEGTFLVGADLSDATLDGVHVYGVSVWDVNLTGARQSRVIVSRADMPEVTVDDLSVAQFIHLMLGNRNIRQVIDTLTSKVVLILGRFTPERKAVLDALRQRLSGMDFVPVIFDFDIPEDRDVTETVTLLARMARFIIADLTEPSSIPQELHAIVPEVAVPVKPLIQGEAQPYAMFRDLRKYPWMLPPHRYSAIEDLVDALEPAVIGPAQQKADELAEQKGDAWS